MTTNYISIRSVLFDLSTLIDDRYYNETTALEWAAQGLQKLRVSPKLEEKLYVTNVTDYSATIPSDLKYLIQIASKESVYFDGSATIPVDSINDALAYPPIFSTGTYWQPMRQATSSAMVNKNLASCSQCLHSFSITPNGVINTSLEEGCIIILYKGYPLDEDGDLLIPDSQDLKDALLHYMLFKYWMSKYSMKEEGAESRMNFHLQMYSTLSKKCQHLNNPDVNQLETISGLWNRLIAPTNRFDNLFTTLGNREQVNF